MTDKRRLQRVVNLEYAVIHGVYWASFCGIVSFASVYLQARGYSNTGLGQVLACGYVLGFLLPQVLAAWIDRSETVTVYHCQWGLFILQAILIFVLQLLPGRSTAASVLSCLLIGTEITLNPMNTEISADLELSLCHINYGMARGTGSLVFAPVAMVMGQLIENLGVQILPWVNYFWLFLQAAALLVLSLSIRGRRTPPANLAEEKALASSFPVFFRENRRFFGMLLGVAFLFTAHNLVNNYLINVVHNAGGDTSDMGGVSGFTALVEIPMMFLYDRLLRRVSCSSTVRIAAAAFAGKMLCIALATSMTGLYAANLLQFFSFAMLTPALVQYVNLYIPHKDSAKGQAIAFGTVTVGNVLSSCFGGILYDALSVRTTLLIGFAVSVLGAVICISFAERTVRSPQRSLAV